MNSKSPVNCFVSNHQYFEKFVQPPKKIPPPSNFTIGLCTYLPLVIIHC